MHAKSLQSCLTLCDLVDCSPPGSSIYGILQAIILEWVAISSSRGSSRPRDRTQVSYVSCIGRKILYLQCHLIMFRSCFPGGSDSKASACSAGDQSSIPGLGRSPGEGNGNPLQYSSWKIPWMEVPGRLQSMGSQRVRHGWATALHFISLTLFTTGSLPLVTPDNV